MSSAGWLLLAAVALAVCSAYAAGRAAGRGRCEQQRGDLADQLAAERGKIRRLERRCDDQYARIRALTDWEVIDRATVPGVLRALPVPLAAPDLAWAENRRVSPRRGRAARTAAFLDVPPLAPVGEPVQDDDPGPELARAAVSSGWREWGVITAQIDEARLWLATL